MEHIIIIELQDNMIRIKPEDGYKLYHIYLDKYFSEAVISRDELNNFKAVEA